MVDFTKKIQAQFALMIATGNIFVANVSGNDLWLLYLLSFENAKDPIFRDPESTTHTCNTCNNFIRRYGNLVAIDKDLNIITLFDFIGEGEFTGVPEELHRSVINSGIKTIFVETFKNLQELKYDSKLNTETSVFRVGIDKNTKRYTKEEAEMFGGVKPNELRVFNHMYLDIPKKYVSFSSESKESLMAYPKGSRDVFTRLLNEVSLDTFKLVRDLINQDSILDAKAHLPKILKFIELSADYENVPANKKHLWTWVNSVGFLYANLRSELIGTLLVDLAEGKNLNEACKLWNIRVDPANYMRATTPITENQRKEAAKFVEENDYMESFDRRLATLQDIKVNDILHINSGSIDIKKITVFDKLKPVVSTRHKKSEFDKVEEVSIEKFMKDILPTCESVEVFLESKHEKNMVNITTTVSDESKPIFKWGNNYSKSFRGNTAGKSRIKEAVKKAGGHVDGVLNFRLMWNDDANLSDHSDLDLWASEPSGNRIGFDTPYRKDRAGSFKSNLSGQLDVDNTRPGDNVAVENITWHDINKMENGSYKVWVNQFTARDSKGFKLEIEFNDEIYLYEYKNPISTDKNINVAEVTLKDGLFSIEHKLPVAESANKTIYGLDSNSFHRVELVCLDPGHWGSDNIGNKYYMFMLDGCHTTEPVRTFYNEDLIPDLLTHHKKVMDVLGSQCAVEGGKDQLAGVGFNSDERESVVLKLSGSHKRVIRVKF